MLKIVVADKFVCVKSLIQDSCKINIIYLKYKSFLTLQVSLFDHVDVPLLNKSFSSEKRKKS